MSTFAEKQFAALRGATRKEKGGAPEDARRSMSMENILEARPPSNGLASFSITSERKKFGVWLDDLVAKSKGKPTARIISLTPALAELLLDRNPDNRKINQRSVELFAREMSSGRWEFNGEPIIVSDDGKLNDGQHRCAAVVMSGVPIDVILIAGVERDTRLTLDRGRQRTVGDYLSMSGHSYASALGAAAAAVWQYRTYGYLATSGRQRATKSEILQTINENPGIERSVAVVSGPAARSVGGVPLIAFAHFVLGTVSREGADNFIHLLLTGEGLKAGNPILYLRNRLINERGRLRAPEKAELIFKGWNAWRRGGSGSFIRITGSELPKLER